MEQFSLEKYLANPSRKVVTREGKNVRILCTNRKLYSAEVIGLAMNNDGTEGLISCSKQGKSFILNDSSFDLFFAPEKHEGWVNIYQVGKNKKCGFIYETEEAAKDQFESNEHIATIKIEWKE